MLTNILQVGFSRVNITPIYEEGGYEAGNSHYKADVAEIIIRASLDMLKNLK